MDSLIAICESLSIGEIKLVKHFYKIRNNDDNLKRGKLFEILLAHKIIQDKEVAKQLGYSSIGSSFQNLKQRLKADILSVLLMQECTAKFSTPYAQATFECRRNLMQGEILMSRGVYDEAMDVLNKATRITAKYQLYAEQLQIEDLIRNHTSLKGNVASFKAINNSIGENYKMLGNVLEAKKIHYEITNPRLMGVQSLPEYIEKAGDVVKELSELSESTSCSRIGLYRDLSAINYYSSSHDFEKAEKYAQSLIKSVEKDPVVLSSSNQAGANMELANIYLNTKNYEKAIEYAGKAVHLFKPGMINQLHAYIILFFAYFRNNQFDEASQILSIAQDHRLIKSQKHPLMQSRIHLLKAALCFKQGEIDKSSFILNRNAEISRDKDGWMPGFYMLDLLILMEKKSVDLANYKLEAFRKMLHRHGIDKQEMRIAVITRILKNLVKQECNFQRIFPVHETEIRMLSEAKEQYYWNPAGYEVIRFDEWLLKKVS
jgi:tetratricopeptide (TPR) repeat protein